MKSGSVCFLVVLMSISVGCEKSTGTKEEEDGGVDAAGLVDSGEIPDGEIPDADMADAFPQPPIVEDPFNIEDAVCREDGWCWHWPYPVGAVLYGGTVDSEETIYAVGYNGTILRWPKEGSPSILGRGEAMGYDLWTAWKADDGTLWVGGNAEEGYPMIFKYKDGVLEKESDPVVELIGEDHGFIHRIKGNGGRLWAVGVKGYYDAHPDELDSLVLYHENDTWHEIGTPYESKIVNDLAFSPSGEVWFALAAGNIIVYTPQNDSWRIVAPEPMQPWARIWWQDGELYVYALTGVFAKMNEDETFVELGRVPVSYQPRGDMLPGIYPFLTPAEVDEDGTLTVLVNDWWSGDTSIYEVSEERGAERIYGPAEIGYLISILKKQGESYVGFGSRGYTFSFSKETGYKDIYRIPPWDRHRLSLWEQGEDVVAVTTGGHLIRFDGTQWQTISEVPGLSDDTVYASPSTLWAEEGCLYAAVERGEIYKYTDSEWEALPYEKDLGRVRSICGFSCDEVYMATSHHLFSHTETGWEEIPPPEDERFKINSLFCKKPGRLYIAGSGLYVWEDGEWTIELPAEQNADDAWMSRRFVWGHEDDDTLYVDHNSGHSTMVRKDGEDIWQEWSPDEIPADLYYDSFFVGGVRGFTEHTIWGFANHSYFAVRPENFGWNVDNLLYGTPTGLPDRAKSAWVSREGEVFVHASGLDISFVPFRGMTVKNPD